MILHPDDSPARDGRGDAPATRRRFLGRTTLAAAGGVALVAAAPGATLAAGPGTAELARNFRSIQRHENAHVQLYQQLLGEFFPTAQFVNLQQRNYQAFRALSVTFENTGSQTYLGATPLFFNRDRLAIAGRVAFVEARHAGWLNTIVGGTTTQNVNDGPLEAPLTPLETAQRISPYLADPNAGAALASAITTTPSDRNDVAILQFAAVLEQLEATFYNLNVERFF